MSFSFMGSPLSSRTTPWSEIVFKVGWRQAGPGRKNGPLQTIITIICNEIVQEYTEEYKEKIKKKTNE